VAEVCWDTDTVHSADLRPGRIGRIVALAASLLGVVAVVTGTFLPWVRSGQVDRNLYTMAGFVDRVGLLGPGASVSGWLALIGPLCAIPVVLAVLRMHRAAAVVGLLIALAGGGFAASTLLLAAGRTALGVSLAPVGPATVLVGAVLRVAGGVGVLLTGRAPRAARQQPSPHYLSQSDPRGVPEHPHW
jgi:hypothetical protein